MKLDKSIKKGKKPLTGLDLEEATEFIGQQGYFADYVEHFENLQEGIIKDRLLDVYFANPNVPFRCEKGYYRYFLPKAFIGQEFRPFTLEEFNRHYNIGDKVVFCKSGKEYDQNPEKLTMLYVGSIESYYGKDRIILGIKEYTFDELFENYCIYNCDKGWEWIPFGVRITE